MPNYYAHLKFGGKVLEELSPELAAYIEPEREAFDLGCLGPDPLFFFRPLAPSSARREGVRMHRNSALPVAERLRRAIEEGVPMSRGYGAGFLCHLALDSACHGYVYEQAAQGPISHMAIEGEYDRRLIRKDGLPVKEGVHMPRVTMPDVWQAAAAAYEHATARKMRCAYRNMYRCSDFLVKSYGKLRGRALDVVSHLPACGSIRGVALDDTPHPATYANNTALDRLLTEAVPETAEQIGAFFEAIVQRGPIPGWFDKNFKGCDAVLPLQNTKLRHHAAHGI